MKKYLLFLSSYSGMGSNTDMVFVDDENLRRIIRLEVHKMKAGKAYCMRMTGTWNDEVFCDSRDSIEIEEDVIKKRMTTCSTYHGVNDLVLLPDSIEVEKREEIFSNTIFKVLCQDCVNSEVAVGKSIFTRYIIKLNEIARQIRVQDYTYYEFTSWQLENVLESYYLESIDTKLLWARDMQERAEEKSYNNKDAICTRANTIIARCQRTLPDSAARDRLFLQDRDIEGLESDEEIINNNQGFDFLRNLYRYPLAFPRTGIGYTIYDSHGKDVDIIDNFYFCDEIFTNGIGVYCLPAILTGHGNSKEKFIRPAAGRALGYAFCLQ